MFYVWADKIGTVFAEDNTPLTDGNYMPCWTSRAKTYQVSKVPEAQAWLKLFERDALRYPILVVLGASRTGKTEWAKNLFHRALELKIGTLEFFPETMRQLRKNVVRRFNFTCRAIKYFFCFRCPSISIFVFRALNNKKLNQTILVRFHRFRRFRMISVDSGTFSYALMTDISRKNHSFFGKNAKRCPHFRVAGWTNFFWPVITKTLDRTFWSYSFFKRRMKFLINNKKETSLKFLKQM